MSISPINFNGMIQSTNEVSSIKANEDQKGMLQQENLTVAVDKKIEHNTHQVNEAKESDKAGWNYERQGDGSGYQGNKNKSPFQKKGKQDEKSDGKVSLKDRPSFDIKI